MGKIGSIFLGLISLFLLIGPFRTPIIDGIKGWRTLTTYNEENVMPDAAGAANITLSYDLYQAALGEVILPITTNTTGAPAPASYSESDKKLLVDGLNVGEYQRVHVDYYGETDDPVMQILGPFLAFIIFFGVAGAIIWAMVSKSGSRG